METTISRIAKTYGLKPRGVLNLWADGERIQYSRRLPSAKLTLWIEHYWMVRWDLRGSGPFIAQTVSHPSIHLVLEEGNSRIYGVVKGRSSRTLEGLGRVFCIKFRPGGFHPFLRAPVSNLTNRSLPLDQVFPSWGRAFEQAILRHEGDEERIHAAEDFLLDRIPESDESARFAGQIVDEICLNREMMTVDSLADHFNLNKRMLQRIFGQYIGVTPKWVIRVYRIHEIVEGMKEDQSVDFARLAQDLGYFDQAHFLKDFKSIVGWTPTEYLEQIRKAKLPAQSETDM